MNNSQNATTNKTSILYLLEAQAALVDLVDPGCPEKRKVKESGQGKISLPKKSMFYRYKNGMNTL